MSAFVLQFSRPYVGIRLYFSVCNFAFAYNRRPVAKNRKYEHIAAGENVPLSNSVNIMRWHVCFHCRASRSKSHITLLHVAVQYQGKLFYSCEIKDIFPNPIVDVQLDCSCIFAD